MPSTSELRRALAPVAVQVAAMPAGTNVYGHIFEGWLVGQMKTGGRYTGARRSRGRAVTVAIKVTSPLSRKGWRRGVGGCATDDDRPPSERIAIEAWQRDRDGGATREVGEAMFTFAAVGPDGRPRSIPDTVGDHD